MLYWRQVYLCFLEEFVTMLISLLFIPCIPLEILQQFLEFEPIFDKQHYLSIEKGSSDGINTLTRCFFYVMYYYHGQ